MRTPRPNRSKKSNPVEAPAVNACADAPRIARREGEIETYFRATGYGLNRLADAVGALVERVSPVCRPIDCPNASAHSHKTRSQMGGGLRDMAEVISELADLVEAATEAVEL